VVGSQFIVPPGGEGAIEVSLDTASFQGRKTKTVLVSTNDEEHPVGEFTLTGHVTPRVVADPPVLYLGRIRPGAGATGEIRILSMSGEPIEVASAAAENLALEVAVEGPSSAGNREHRVIVRVPPETLSGRFSGTLRIKTTKPEPLELDVPVLGSVEGDRLVQPSQVMFGSKMSGRSGGRALHVRN
jgi:hypothetical protein